MVHTIPLKGRNFFDELPYDLQLNVIKEGWFHTQRRGVSLNYVYKLFLTSDFLIEYYNNGKGV